MLCPTVVATFSVQETQPLKKPTNPADSPEMSVCIGYSVRKTYVFNKHFTDTSSTKNVGDFLDMLINKSPLYITTKPFCFSLNLFAVVN